MMDKNLERLGFPLQFGTPIPFSERSILSPEQRGYTNSSSLTSRDSIQHAFDVLAGSLLFDCNPSPKRNRSHNRVDAFKHSNQTRNFQEKPFSPVTPTSDDGMSSTSKIILDGLEKMSTPTKEVKNIPRASKQRQVILELFQSGQPVLRSYPKRNRPILGPTTSTLESCSSYPVPIKTWNQSLINPVDLKAKSDFPDSQPTPDFSTTPTGTIETQKLDDNRSSWSKFAEESFPVPTLSGVELAVSISPFKFGKTRPKLGQSAKELFE